MRGMDLKTFKCALFAFVVSFVVVLYVLATLALTCCMGKFLLAESGEDAPQAEQSTPKGLTKHTIRSTHRSHE
jgi:hypothetical protein